VTDVTDKPSSLNPIAALLFGGFFKRVAKLTLDSWTGRVIGVASTPAYSGSFFGT